MTKPFEGYGWIRSDISYQTPPLEFKWIPNVKPIGPFISDECNFECLGDCCRNLRINRFMLLTWYELEISSLNFKKCNNEVKARLSSLIRDVTSPSKNRHLWIKSSADVVIKDYLKELTSIRELNEDDKNDKNDKNFYGMCLIS